MKIKELLTESVKNQVEFTGKEVWNNVRHIFQDTARDFKDQANIPTSSVPAGPNTSSFRATKYGGISVEQNLTVHGLVNTTFAYALKIGGALDQNTLEEIVAVVRDDLFDDMGIEFDPHGVAQVECSDGIVLSIVINYGSAWHAIGMKRVR